MTPARHGVMEEVKAQVENSAEDRIWEKASHQYLGKGVEKGTDFTQVKKLRRQLKREGCALRVGLLDTIVQGATWPEARRFAAGYSETPTCRFCSAGEGATRHQAWECENLLKRLGDKRKEARHLEWWATGKEGAGQAEAEKWATGYPPAEQEAFWSRGIMTAPRSLGLLLEAEPRTRLVGKVSEGHPFVVRGDGTETTAGTDGSGGAFATEPRRRKVGWGWVILNQRGAIVAGAHGGVEGKQSVPRAEMQAIRHLLENVQREGNPTLIVYIDNQYVVDTLDKIRAGWKPGPGTKNGQLWGAIWDLKAKLEWVQTRKSRPTWRNSRPSERGSAS